MVAVAVAAATLAAVAGPAHVADADAGLVQLAEWKPFPGDAVGHGYIAVDATARIGYAFSNGRSGAPDDETVWTRVQALDLDTGKPRGGVLTIPRLTSRAPVLVDAKRHVVLYASSYTKAGVNLPEPSSLVGIGFRDGAVKQLFSVPAPTGLLRVAGMAWDDTGRDVVIAATMDGAGQSANSASNVIDFQRVVVADLMAGKVTTRWATPARLKPGTCQALIQTSQPADLLVVGDRIFTGCRNSSTGATDSVPQANNGLSSGVAEITGVGPGTNPSPVARLYRVPGNFLTAGESVVDVRQQRVLLAESGGYNGLRVFDARSRRYVGRMNGNQEILYGSTVDPRTSRVYFISFDPEVGLAYGDDAALVPTQGERFTTPYAALVQVGGCSCRCAARTTPAGWSSRCWSSRTRPSRTSPRRPWTTPRGRWTPSTARA
jgi:hypothetical protein